MRSDPHGDGVPVGVAIATRDRAGDLLATLARLRELPERPPIAVADNGSSDGTPAQVAETFPDVAVVALGRNRGGAARTDAVRALDAPYIAFCDDDSWWAPGSLARAAAILDAHPRVGLLAAAVQVEPAGRADPVTAAMASSPLGTDAGLPGPAVLGFLACGAIVRREAYLGCGGFVERFGVGGEEEVLALDLAAAGWSLCHVPDVVAHHRPSPARDPAGRRRTETRNALWAAWLRRRWPGLARRTAAVVGARDRSALLGTADAVAGLPWVVRERRAVPAWLEARARLLDA